MSKEVEKNQARIMRRKGESIIVIARTLKVSKSSVSAWCRDIELTNRQKERLVKSSIHGGSVGRLLGAQMNRQKKESAIRESNVRGDSLLSSLSDRELLIAGVAVYWGEGSKSGQLSFINSDPEMLLFMKEWFSRCFKVQTEDFMPRVFINHVHKKRNVEVVRYWSELLHIPKEQFRATVYHKTLLKKKYENHDTYKGLLALRIRRSTNLKYDILGLIHGLKSSKLPLSADVAQLVRASHS